MSYEWSLPPGMVVVTTVVTGGLVSRPAAAHAGSLSGTYSSAPIPSWLVTLTGAAVVGASFLCTCLVTDERTLGAITRRGIGLPSTAAVRAATALFAKLLGIVALLSVLAVGFLGPSSARGNAAVLLVWAGWWAGYTMTVYLVADTWPLVSPWRTLGRALPRQGWVRYPADLGSWPAVAGLLVLVFVEVVTPLAAAPRLLAALVAGYTVTTVAGIAVIGRRAWFEHVDPITAVFRTYGRMAPIQRTPDGVRIGLPGAALVDSATMERAETAFVVALLWGTTFDGLVTTPAWASLVRSLVAAGVPALVVYLLALVSGFALFLGVYRGVDAWARRTADSYVTAGYVRDWFAPSLVPIAAGYHLAHYLGYFLSLAPALGTTLVAPLDPPATVPMAVLPGWFGTVQLTFVVLGHLLAVWVAHVRSFSLFTGRLQPLRSQYPLVIVMIAYTMTSMWIVSQPFSPPPFV